jgi:hypothetical protein
VGGFDGTDSRDASVPLARKCDGEAGDGHMDATERVPCPDRHTQLRRRFSHYLTGQHLQHWCDDDNARKETTLPFGTKKLGPILQ